MSAIERLYWEEEMAKVPKRSQKKRARPSKGKKEYLTVWLPSCRHWRQPFELKNGLTVFASAWLDKPDVSSSQIGGFSGLPDIGFYLDAKWASSTIVASAGMSLPFVRASRRHGQMIVYPWEDWGVPASKTELRKALTWLLKQVGDGNVIEIGCMGGHGRTGTALACMLALQGLSAKEAISRVWNAYCEEAIESQRQIEFVNTFAKRGPR